MSGKRNPWVARLLDAQELPARWKERRRAESERELVVRVKARNGRFLPVRKPRKCGAPFYLDSLHGVPPPCYL